MVDRTCITHRRTLMDLGSFGECIDIKKNWHPAEPNGEGREKCALVKKKMAGGVIILALESSTLFVKENKREIITGKSGQ